MTELRKPKYAGQLHLLIPLPATCGARRANRGGGDEERSLSQSSVSSGFTLIELMVAMTLLAMMLTLLYGAFFLGHRAAEKAEARFDRNQTLRAVEEFLGGLIRSAYPYRAPGGQAVLFTGEESNLTFVSSVSMGIEGRGDSKISLSWGSGAGADLTLEEEIPVRGAGYRTSVVLWRDVSNLKLEYLDPQSREEEWVTQWDGENKRDLPRAVRMTLLDGSGKEHRWMFPVMLKVLSPS